MQMTCVCGQTLEWDDSIPAEQEAALKWADKHEVCRPELTVRQELVARLVVAFVASGKWATLTTSQVVNGAKGLADGILAKNLSSS